MRRPTSQVLLVVLALLVAVAGCGDDPPSADRASGLAPTATSPTSSPTTEPGGEPSTPAPSPTPTERRKSVLGWILSLGPGAPEGPPEFTAYRELSQLRCAEVFDRVGELREPARTLYTGAAEACLAALEGRTELWPRAGEALAAVQGQSDGLHCLDQAALGLLERLVALHEQDSQAEIALAETQQWEGPPCPDVTTLSPDTGPDGTTVTVSGRNFRGNVVAVEVFDDTGARQGAAIEVTEGAVRVTMPEAPPPEASRTVCVVLVSRPDWRAAGALFTYASEAGGGSPTGDPSAEPTEVPEAAPDGGWSGPCPPPDES